MKLCELGYIKRKSLKSINLCSPLSGGVEQVTICNDLR